jgi:hypothetical protein
MTAANDLGLTTAVPARSTIYADTYPRTIDIKANAGDPHATKAYLPVGLQTHLRKDGLLGGPTGDAGDPGTQLVSG